MYWKIEPATYNSIKVFVIIILISLLKTQIARVSSLRKQPTFGNASTSFRPPNDVRKTSAEIPYWWHVDYSDLDRAAELSCRLGNLIQPIRSTIQIWVVTSHQYGISALVSQTSFGGKPVAVSPSVRCFLRLPCKVIRIPEFEKFLQVELWNQLK